MSGSIAISPGRLPLQLFRVVSHAGIWRVIHNGVFYRDYCVEADAVEGAQAAALKAEQSGHAVRVVTSAEDHRPL